MKLKDELAHAHNDLETLRSRTQRILTEEISMLDDALSALRKGKPHVTEDHIERVRDRLQKEVDRLNG